VIDERLRGAAAQRAGRAAILIDRAGFQAERTDEIVDGRRGLHHLLVVGRGDVVGIGVGQQAVEIVAALLRAQLHRSADTTGELATVVRADDRLEESLIVGQISADTSRGPTSVRVRVAADLAESVDRRRRPLTTSMTSIAASTLRALPWSTTRFMPRIYESAGTPRMSIEPSMP
jgi:hypothetical protein